MSGPRIQSQRQFETELDATWAGIEADCLGCKDPDCMGYVWLTEPDQDRFVEGQIQFVRANGPTGPCFVNSYRRTRSGALDPSVRSPKCPHRLLTGACGIHEVRPVVCRMYPLGVEMLIDEGPFWVLHLNCAHVRRLSQTNKLSRLKFRLERLLDRLDTDFRLDIENTFLKAAELSEPTLDRTILLKIRPFTEPEATWRL